MKQNSIGLISVLAIAILAVGFAVYEMKEAQRYANIVRVDELAAQSVALRDTRFDLSLLLSVEAFHLADNYRTRGVLLDSVQVNPQLIQYLHEDIGRPSSIVFSPDGKIIAAGYFGGEIILWDVATGKPNKQLVAKWTPSKELQAVLGDANLGPVGKLVFTLDGKILISEIYTLYDDERIIALWDVATGQSIAHPLLENKSPYDLIFSPDGKTLAISEWGDICFWDMETSQFVGEFPVPPFEGLGGLNTMPVVSSPVFSPDGKMLAAISSVNTITFWDVSTLKPIGQPLVVGDSYSRNGVDHIAFQKDGMTLLTVNADGTLTSWDLETRESIHQLPFLQTKDSYVLFGYGAVFSPDTNLVAITDGDVINVLDSQTGQQISQQLKGNINNIGDMAFSSDEKMFASAGNNGVILWDLAGRRPLGQIIGEHGGSSVAFSPDGKLLAADTYFDENDLGFGVALWEMTTRELVGSLSSENYSDYQHVVFSPNGSTIAAGVGQEIILWDATTHEVIDQFQLGANAYLSSLAFSPDGKVLAAGNDLEVTLWDLENRQLNPQTLKARDAMVESLAFSPGGETLAVGDTSNTIRIWDLQTLDFIDLTGDFENVDGLSFSPDGVVLASTDRNGRIILWDVKSWEVIGRPFILPTGSIPSTLAFSPDGKMLASGNYDNTIDLWDVETRQPIGKGLAGNDWPVGEVVFSPDGNSLATTSNKIILWDVNPRAWMEKICRRAGRNFTRAEWAQYFPGETYRVTCPQWPLEIEAEVIPTIAP